MKLFLEDADICLLEEEVDYGDHKDYAFWFEWMVTCPHCDKHTIYREDIMGIATCQRCDYLLPKIEI